jgi:hypothetical protein
MAINNPLKEGVNAAGGYLVPDEYANLLIQGVRDESAALTLAGNVQTTSAKTMNFPVLTDTPEASFVGEGEKKPTSGAGFSQFTINVKKLAVIIPMTTELLDDAVYDPRVLIDAPVRKAFARLIDQHILGYAKDAPVSTNFNNALCDTTQAAYLGAEHDALRLSISDAMGKIEANGYSPNGVILPSDARQYLRDARQAVESTNVLYQGTDWSYGMRNGFSSNLQPMDSQSTGPVGIIGDFSQLVVRMRQDISVSVSDQAVVTINGEPVSLWESNLVALRYEMRVACGAFDLNRSFAKIIAND